MIFRYILILVIFILVNSNKLYSIDTIVNVKYKNITNYKNEYICDCFTFANTRKTLYLNTLNIFKLSNISINHLDIKVIGGNLIGIYREEHYFFIYPKAKEVVITFKVKNNKKVLCSKTFSTTINMKPWRFSIMYNHKKINPRDTLELALNKKLYVEIGGDNIKEELPMCEYYITGHLTIYLARGTIEVAKIKMKLNKEITLNKLYEKAKKGDRLVIYINVDPIKDCWGSPVYVEDIILYIPMRLVKDD